MSPDRRLLILGLGNVLCGDDGLGVAALARLARRWRLPESVEMMDGGTLGLALLHHVRAAETLLIVDAIRADGGPGTFVRLEGDDVAPAVESRLSVHQIGVADLLDGLRWTDSSPQRIVLLGLVPRSMELHVGLSPEVEVAMDGLVEAVAAEVADLGFPLTARGPDEAVPASDSRFAPRALGL